MSEDVQYATFFESLTGRSPYGYQRRVSNELLAGKNVVLHAPTGCGKTFAVALPYLYQHLRGQGPRRLIYALPLRTLVESISREISTLVAKTGSLVEVTTQTGEQPNDPFFTLGDVIVTTYDQVLSGLLCSPYGLPSKLANINAGVLAGNLVVFDEFHLMETARAFATALACLEAQGDMAQSVWMTATATTPLRSGIARRLRASVVDLSSDDLAGVPSIGGVARKLVADPSPITVDAVIEHAGNRSIVLFNTVARAQDFFEELDRHPRAPPTRILLHARFFQTHRRAKVKQLLDAFGRKSQGPAILVATQVVEAGVDITADHLHTEVCPMNALVQRAGRCARFASEGNGERIEGTVHVHSLGDNSPLPYEAEAVSRTWRLVLDKAGSFLDPSTASEWVDAVHGATDSAVLEGTYSTRKRECLDVIAQNAFGPTKAGVSHLIRAGEDSIRVLVAHEPPDRPAALEGIALRRVAVMHALEDTPPTGRWGWAYAAGEDPAWAPVTPGSVPESYVVCVTPAHANYDDRLGMRLGGAGTGVSPQASPAKRPGYAPLRRESWTAHTRAVLNEACRRLEDDLRPRSPLARSGRADVFPSAVKAASTMHDIGKLQDPWQRWACEAQRLKEPSWRGLEPLAHTDFDPSSREDRRQLRSVPFARPAHSAAGSWFGALVVADLLSDGIADDRKIAAASAAIAAVLAHHGGWLPSPLEVAPLVPASRKSLATLLAQLPTYSAFARWTQHPDKHRTLQQLLDQTTGPETLPEWWPTVAYVTRTLRLSDQRATSEGSNDA